jgi:hypothetical protein
MAELLTAVSCLAHIGVQLRKRLLNYKILYYESAILLAVGLSSWVYLWSQHELFDVNAVFTTLTGSWLFPLEPIDLIFLGLGLLISTVLLDFITRLYNLNRSGLLAILPWTIVGQYRFLHELLWNFQYWITLNLGKGNFSDYFPKSLFGQPWIPALLTQTDAILFLVFTIFNFFVIVQAFTVKQK